MRHENKILFIKTLVILAILIALGIYNHNYNGELYQQELKKSKEWNLGGLYVKSVNDSSFYAESFSDTVYGTNFKPYLPDGFELKVGDLVKIKSEHLSGDSVKIKFLNVSRDRFTKIWVSIIPFLIIGYLLTKHIKFDSKIKRFIIK
jgi:hypothetical protein